MYIVYKTIDTRNGNIYVGVHKQSTLDDDGYRGSGRIISAIMKKYDANILKRETIQVFYDAESAYALEGKIVDEDFIKRSDTYNIKLGGHGGFDDINERRSNGEWENPMHDQNSINKMIEAAAKTRSKKPEFYANVSKQNLELAYAKNIGTPRSEETKKKISEKQKGRKYSEERKQNMKNSWTDEKRKVVSARQSGRVLSEATKEKIRNVVVSDETKQKLRKAWTEERKLKKQEEFEKRPLLYCPYCDIVSKQIGTMRKHHFENCKHKKG